MEQCNKCFNADKCIHKDIFNKIIEDGYDTNKGLEKSCIRLNQRHKYKYRKNIGLKLRKRLVLFDK